jgi:hypothetical protein
VNASPSVYYVNRNPANRKRHADPDCRGLRVAREWLAELHETGFYDGFEESEGRPPPTDETRFVEVRPRNAQELAALEAFTIPCLLCMPGARALKAACPVDFEDR